MFKRRRLNKLKSPSKLGDSTRRRIARKATRSNLTKRRLKQISLSLEDSELAIAG